MRVESFTDKIKGQHDIILPRLITRIGCMITLNNYHNYHMIRLFTNWKCTFPTNNNKGHSGKLSRW